MNCPGCGGLGQVSYCDEDDHTVWDACPKCEGTGQIEQPASRKIVDADEATRFLLDGLEVDSIRTLKAIVDGARNASRIYEGLRVDENDGEFALWRDADLVNALHELGALFG